MNFISYRVILSRIKAIKSMMKDKTVPKRKKLLIVAGLVYLFMPLDIAPVVLGPVALVDDMVLWLWIIWNLKDTLDTYWVGEKVDDFSKDFSGKNLVEGVEFKVDEEE
jgi:uncharacterized membrane protein YkvA (DUF1232 family)